MNSGVGNLVGYTIIAWWYEFCRHGNLVDWPRFWGVLGIAAGLLTIMFVIGYKGRKRI
jgi:hypothetical protein